MKKNIIKKIEYHFETIEYYFEVVAIMVLMPLLLATPLFLLIWGIVTTYFLT